MFSTYRRVLDENTIEPTLGTDGSLSLVNALAMANRANETLAIEGEAYVRTILDKRRAVASFFPTLDLAPSYAFRERSGGGGADGDLDVSIDGDLTMIGVTKPVQLKVVEFHCGPQPFNKKPMCGADAVATIKRSDWGMTNGVATSSPTDEITLRLPVEAYLEPQG